MAGRTILITGGARGIGRATAIQAAERCWSVAISRPGNGVPDRQQRPLTATFRIEIADRYLASASIGEGSLALRGPGTGRMANVYYFAV